MISVELARLLDRLPLTAAQKARLNSAADYDAGEERDIARLSTHLSVYFATIRAWLEQYLTETAAASKSASPVPPIPDSVETAISAVLADTAIRAVLETLRGFGEATSGSGQAIAAAWATMHAAELVRQVSTSTQAAINAAVSDFASTPGADIASVMAKIPLDQARAQVIATTEITRAYAVGQERAADVIYKMFPRSRIIKTWMTRHDDRVCPICGPLNGQNIGQEEQWTANGAGVLDVFGAALFTPPAHPNCRCRVQYRAARNGE